MKLNSKDDLVSIDEERVRVARQVDLANNLQARYAAASSAYLLKLSNDDEESKILFEISLGLRC